MTIANCNHLEQLPEAPRAPRAAASPGRREFMTGALSVGAGLVGLSVLGSCASIGAAGPADTMIVNGKIATLNPKHPFVSAIAIKDGKVIATGSDAELQHLRGPNTTVPDARRDQRRHRRHAVHGDVHVRPGLAEPRRDPGARLEQGDAEHVRRGD